MTIGGARPRPAGPALQDPPLPQTRGAGRTIWEDRNMKKRLISWLLILALCVSVLPAAALAAEPEDTALTGAEQTVDPAETEPESDPAEAKQALTPAEPLRAVTSGEGTHTHYHCGGATCNKEGHEESTYENTTFKEWTYDSKTGWPTKGNFYLTGDVTLSDTLTVSSGNLTLCLNGYSITMDKVSNKDVIKVENGRFFTLCDCKRGGATDYGTIGHTQPSQFNGRGVTVEGSGSQFTMYGGRIANNMVGGAAGDERIRYGGGVLVCNKGIFSMVGGEITGNTAKYGGGVAVGLANGLHGNTNEDIGGTFNMTGGRIYENTCTYNGGGVYACASNALNFCVSDAPQITGNYYAKGNVANNVYLEKPDTGDPAKIIVSQLTSAASIGVTVPTPDKGMFESQVVATFYGDVFAKHFFSDAADRRLQLDGNQLIMVASVHENHPICGASCTHNGKHENKTWTAAAEPSEMWSANTNYYLTQDIKLDKTWSPKHNVTLCLNGYSIIADGDFDAIEVSAGYTFTLCDCNGGGEITHAEGKTGAGVYMKGAEGNNKTAIFDMYGGTISGNTGHKETVGGAETTRGGGVYVDNDARFHMYGGTITGNTAAQGGGVYYVASNRLYVSGKVDITGNKGTDGEANNVYVLPARGATPPTVPFYIGPDNLDASARIGVRVDDNVIATGAHSPVAQFVSSQNAESAYHEGNFISDNGEPYGFKMEPKDSAHTGITSTHVVNLYNGLPHQHPICGETCTDGMHTGEDDILTWIGVSSLSDITGAGNYYLTQDVTIYAWTVPVVDGWVNLCLNGHSITSNSNNAAAITIDWKSTGGLVYGKFALCDCNGSKNNNGIITHETSAGGVGVQLLVNATFDMYGGRITGNNNYGVNVSNSAAFHMYGGGITGNSYGVDVDGAMTVSGDVKITDNTNCNVDLLPGKPIMVSGALGGNAEIGVTTTIPDDSYVTVAKGTDTSPLTESDLGRFESDNTSYGKKFVDGSVIIYNGTLHEHAVCGTKSCTDTGHSDQVWLPLTYGTTRYNSTPHLIYGGTGAGKTYNLTPNYYVLPAGNYYLYENITTDMPIMITGDVNLCLNGYTLSTSYTKTADDDYTPFIAVRQNCTLTLCDCDTEGKGTIKTEYKLHNGVQTYYSTKAGEKAGNFTMYGGTITDVVRGVRIGKLAYGEKGTFKMYGGKITGTTRAVYVVDGSDFKMYGGEISGNTAGNTDGNADSYGAGVYVDEGATFTMEGGTISNNTAYRGGGVYLNGTSKTGITTSSITTFTMTGGTITGNTSNGSGAGVQVYDSIFTMSGDAAVSGNTTNGNCGGGVFVTSSYRSASFTMSEDASVSGNTAKNWGGGVYMDSDKSSFTMSGNAAITGNTVGGVTALYGAGGGVYAQNGTFTMSGNAAITGNNIVIGTGETEGGGGVYVARNATMNVSGNVQIHDNWKNGTKNDGTGVYENGSANNLYLFAYETDKVLKTVTIDSTTGGLASTAKIGVTTRYTPTASNPIQFATGATENLDYYTNIFTPDVTGQGYTITQTDNKLYLSAHQHSWNYTLSEEGKTITATCTANGCNLTGNSGGSVTIVKPKHEVYGDGKNATATLESTLDSSITMPTIRYKVADQTETFEAPPVNAGSYEASITMGEQPNQVTATVTYEIGKATPKASDFTFTAPTNLTYDGTPKYPTFTPGIGGVTVYPTYYDAGGNAVSPINVGTYTVKIKVEVSDNDNYNSVNELTSGDWTFTILQADYRGQKSDKTIDIVKGRNTPQTGTLTAADFFPAGQLVPAGAKITNVTGSSSMMNMQLDETAHTLTYTSETNIEDSTDAAYTVTISTTNYNNFTATLTFHPMDKQPQTNFGFKDVVDGKVAKVYGTDTEFTLAATGAATDSTVTYESTNTSVAEVDSTTGKVTIKGAGTAVIKATASATDDYAQGVATYELTVSPKTLTANDLEFTQNSTFTKVYDGNTTATGITVRVADSVLVNGDQLNITGSAVYNSKDVATANQITFTPDAITEGNYRLAATEKVTITGAKINKRTITIASVQVTPKQYDGDTNAWSCITGVTFNGLVNGDELFKNGEYNGSYVVKDYGITKATFDDANVGNHTITGKVGLVNNNLNYTFGSEDETAAFTTTGSITQADSWALTPVNDLTIRYNNRDPQTYTPNWSTLLPTGQIWTYNSENTAYTGSANLSTNTIGADTGVLSYQLSAGNAGDTVTWTITASCSNYQTFTLTVTLSLIARDPQTNFKFENNTTSVSKTYGDEDFTIKATDAAAGSTVSYESSNTSVATVDNTGKVTIVGAGQTTIKAKASATADFEEKEISYTLKVNKLRIHVPTPGKNKLQYDGTTQTYTPDGLNTTYCSITNNTAKDVLANNANYTATVSLRDTANTEWNEGVDNTTPRECQFWILPARAIVTALDKKITTGQPAPNLTTAKLGEDYTITGLYDGDSLGSIGLYYADPADTATEVTTPDTNKAGTYAIVAKLDGEGNSNYTLMSAPGTLTIEAVQTSQKLGISAPGRTPGGSYELTPKNAQPGDTVTITVSPDKGCELGSLTVRDVDGNELDLKRDRSGDYTFTMPKSSVSVSISFVRADDALFDDVFAGDYYYNAVQWAAEQGITGGVGGNLFAPDAACTRAQIVTFLWRAAGSPEPETMSAFKDVPATAYYAKAVAWAVENGITNGTGDGKFSPDAPCTRAQAVTFLARALDESADGAADFTDVSADAYYAKPVAWAVESAVTNGVSKTQFAPNETCTRAQIVTFLYRAYKRMK